MTSDSDKWLTADEVCTLMGISYASLRGRLRYKPPIEVKYIKGECRPQGGRTNELRFSVASLLAHHWITEADLARLTEPLDTPGNQLIASKIVRKRVATYEPMEISLLEKACGPNWMNLKKSELVTLLARRVGKSPSWLWRDHSGEDGRKRKPDLRDTLTPDQFASIERTFITARKFSQFYSRCREAMALGELPVRSEMSWRRLWKQLHQTHKDVRTLHLQGPEALRKSMPHVSRDLTLLAPLEMIVGDYARVDILTDWQGTILTPYLCVFLDCRTFKIVGTALTIHPNSLGVKVALFNCFANFGLPKIIYLDNGKEFNATRIVGKRFHTERQVMDVGAALDDVQRLRAQGILEALNIAPMNALPRNPRTKLVERAFGRGGLSDFCEQFIGYCGRLYQERPERTVQMQKAVRKTGKNEYTDVHTGETMRFMEYEELCIALAGWVEEWNNRPSHGATLKGKSPNEAWNALTLNPDRSIEERWKIRKPPLGMLAFAFLEGKELKVRKSGEIEWKKNIVFYENIDALRKYAGERVQVRYSPTDQHWVGDGETPYLAWVPKSLFVYTLRGEWICEATLKPRLHPYSDPRLHQVLAPAKELMRDAKQELKRIVQKPAPAIEAVQTGNVPATVRKQEEHKKALAESDERERQIAVYRKWLNNFDPNSPEAMRIKMLLIELGEDIEL